MSFAPNWLSLVWTMLSVLAMVWILVLAFMGDINPNVSGWLVAGVSIVVTQLLWASFFGTSPLSLRVLFGVLGVGALGVLNSLGRQAYDARAQRYRFEQSEAISKHRRLQQDRDEK